MIFRRTIQKTLEERAQQYKIVTITGPRQAGKTTLCQLCFPDKNYISLEDPDQRSLCEADPRAFLKRIENGAVLDEIQRVPEFLSYLQTFVDRKKEKGLFILTGSNQLTLNEKVTQSLAGRTALLNLLPLSLQELGKVNSQNWQETAFKGFYPDLHVSNIPPDVFFKNYYNTYVERDVRNMMQLKDQLLFDKFVRLCAGRTGQLTDYSALSAEVGVAVNTIKNWSSILEASYITFRLPPFFENVNKRLIKSPKLYFYDTGLLCYLLNIRSADDLDTHPLRGAVFENMIIVDLYKKFVNKGEDPPFYFYRDSNGHEVDLVVQEKRQWHLFEIKSAMTFNSEFLKGLKYLSEVMTKSKKKSHSSLIYVGEVEQTFEGSNLRNWFKLLQES